MCRIDQVSVYSINTSDEVPCHLGNVLLYYLVNITILLLFVSHFTHIFIAIAVGTTVDEECTRFRNCHIILSQYYCDWTFQIG